MYKVGDLFTFEGQLYLLCRVDFKKVALISLSTANRWAPFLTNVEDPEYISSKEFVEICDGWPMVKCSEEHNELSGNILLNLLRIVMV